MNIPQIDRSNYLKGLLITAKKDNQLTESELKILKNISDNLGFSSAFFTEATENLLANKYITEEPIKFSDEKIAKIFIEDGLKLALSDNELADTELAWLKETAKVNGIDEEWFNTKVKEIKNNPHLLNKIELALFSII